jgi:hypothetical protein
MKAKDMATHFNKGTFGDQTVYTNFVSDLKEIAKNRPAMQGSAAAGLYRELQSKIAAFLVRVDPEKRSMFPKTVDAFIAKLIKIDEWAAAWVAKAQLGKLNDGLYAVSKGYREPNKKEREYLEQQRKKLEEEARKREEAAEKEVIAE